MRRQGLLTELLRSVGRLPMPVLYGLATVLNFAVFKVARYRTQVVRTQLARSFPTFDVHKIQLLADEYQQRIADVAVETLKTFAMSPRELGQRVRIDGLEAVRERLRSGTPVLLLAAHHGNWEWLLQAVAVELGYPVDAVYKPLRNRAAERAMRWMRSRFGATPVPAKTLLPEILKRRHAARVIALAADQVPRTSPTRTWLRFLNQETAFYTGPEAIARATGYPVFIVLMERRGRGRYVAWVEPLADRDPPLGFTHLTGRYAERLEAHIRAYPESWLWGHRRWKIRRPIYEPAVAGRGERHSGSDALD
jgi:KDO2-lipid IV(A) lauroyltransferase